MTPTNNKGQVEVQFNWIFILIVGAIILAFFTTIALTQKKSAEEQTNIDFFFNFEKSLTGISAIEGNQFLLEIPRLDLRYDCTEDCSCGAYVGESRAKAQSSIFELNDKIIFSPNRLKGDKVLLWSVDWTYPYLVTNFLIMTSPEVKYFIEDDFTGQEIFSQLPPEFMILKGVQQRAVDKQLFSANNIQSIQNVAGAYKVKFVFTASTPGQVPSQLQQLLDSDVTAVKIDGTSVIFYQKQGTQFVETGTSYILGETTAYAAVFAEDRVAYACMMNRAFRSYVTVTAAMRAKQSLYDSFFPGTDLTTCKIHYQETPLTVGDSSSFNFLQQDLPVSAFNEFSRNFAAQNENAIRSSCPHLY